MLTFETIDIDFPGTARRTAVPGGWLVVVSTAHYRYDRVMERPDWIETAGSTVFVPDPRHEWDGGDINVQCSLFQQDLKEAKRAGALTANKAMEILERHYPGALEKGAETT